MEVKINKNENSVSMLFLIFTVIYVACLLLSNLIAGKLWAISDSITVPAAVILFPVTYILSDVFTEVYGFKRMRTVIWLGFGCSFFAVLIYLVTIALPHPGYWENQAAYATVLGTTPRVALGSFAGYIFGEFSNSIVMSRMKVATSGRFVWGRTILSTVVGEGLDSIIFITIAFWGTMDSSVVLTMIACQYVFKVAYEVVFTPLTLFVIGRVKKIEDIDTYDHGISYKLV